MGTRQQSQLALSSYATRQESQYVFALRFTRRILVGFDNMYHLLNKRYHQIIS